MTANVKPLPDWCRSIPRRLWPQHPPIFDGDYTREDARLAVELIEALDDESRAWYADALTRLHALIANDA